MNKKNLEGFYFYTTKEIKEALRTLAYKTKKSQSVIIREAINEYLKKEEIQEILNEGVQSK